MNATEPHTGEVKRTQKRRAEVEEIEETERTVLHNTKININNVAPVGPEDLIPFTVPYTAFRDAGWCIASKTRLFVFFHLIVVDIYVYLLL
jgi:hypothetical protein